MSVEIKVPSLSKKFGSEYAVKDLEFNIQRGELFALLGPSGAGKTTTLNLIAGIEQPDSGDVLADGLSIKKMKSQEREFAMVFESYALYPHFTVAENMSFPLKAPSRKGQHTEEEIKAIVHDTARILEIEELLHRYPKELSGGQKQRVGLGRALVRRPKCFLMDEPIAHLDAKLRHHMRGELKKLQKRLGVTTLLATPDYNEVVAMADRAAVLSHGKIEQIGSPLELFKKPSNEIVANAIGDPPINIIRSRIIEESDSIYLRGEGFSIKATGSLKERILRCGSHDAIELGIRPGDIIVENEVAKGILEAEVYVFEPLGGEAIATFSVRGKRVKVTCSADRRLKIGQKVGLSFSLDNIHLFNAGTGEALTS